MRRIFVCSPLRANGTRSILENIALTKKLCSAVLSEGHSPYAPHLFFTSFLDDNKERDRELGMKGGMSWLAVADEMWVYAPDFDSCSEGMKVEIEKAQLFPVPVKVTYMPKAWRNL